MIKILPCIDSNKMAECRKQELDISRERAINLGNSSLKATQDGEYENKQNVKVDWAREVQSACSRKVSISPDTILPSYAHNPYAGTRIQVTNETTLGASRRMIDRGHIPLALNFANGTIPGGGFLCGAKAQEEVLCRSSALYQTLVGDLMYETHNKVGTSEWAIYSPNVPVFRKDDGEELDKPWLLSFISCAAPFAPGMGNEKAANCLEHRINRVLAIARAYRHDTLVLGAWGCGAYANDPFRTASHFRSALENEFNGSFSGVVFAITDWSSERKFLGPFCEVFT